MRLDIHHNYHRDDNKRLDRIEAVLQTILRQIMTISAEVKSLLDAANQLPNIVDAVNTGFAALQKQIADLQAQVANGTPSLSDDDKAALAASLSEVQAAIQQLPANIVQGTGATGTDGNTGVATPPSGDTPAPVSTVVQDPTSATPTAPATAEQTGS